MKIIVTKAYIARAIPKHSRLCMIADAIKGARPQARNILVDLQTIRWTDPTTGTRYFYLTPHLAQQRLLEFDLGRAVQPFTFALTTPYRTRPAYVVEAPRPPYKQRPKIPANKRKYAYLAANRALNHQPERVFGLRMFGAV